MTRSQRLAGALLGGLFLALHLPFLPSSLEDLDSVNFALGIRHYDVALHQPHPPGYPIFMDAAILLHSLGLSEVHALSLVGVMAGGLAVFACLALFASIAHRRPVDSLAWLGASVAGACPLFWLTAARPLSDMAGLAAALGLQAMLVGATTVNAVTLAAFLAAFAAGIRSQVVWLTLPLLVWAVWSLPREQRLRGAIRAGGAYAVGGGLWALPLVMISGGPTAYLRVFYSQGAEDLTGVAMLATTPTVRQLVTALQFTFIAPWGDWRLAGVVLAFAATGVVALVLRDRTTLGRLAIAYGPYVAFDLLFQESITTRYALPTVIPVSYLALRGASLLPDASAIVSLVAVVVASAVLSDNAMYGFASMDAPVYRMLGDMKVAGRPEGAAVPLTPVLAMHRREFFDLRRSFQWAGDGLPQFAQRLSTPPKHEWLELVKYWSQGGHEPVWYIADPLRSDLALIKYQKRPVLYRWPFPTAGMLLGGSRPNELDWHVIESPDWFLGEGWALTPETAGTAHEDNKGPGYGPITGWIRRYQQPVTLMVGGRHLSAAGPNASLRVRVDGAVVLEESVPPGFFLRMLTLPSTAGTGEYAVVTIESDNRELAIEQFDAQPTGRVVYGFKDGWNEQEYTPATGVLWRWSTERSTIRVRPEGHSLGLVMRGEIEAASSSHVTIKVGDAVVSESDVPKEFSLTTVIPQRFLTEPEAVITIESSAHYVPAEKQWRSRDRRILGLKLTECTLTPIS
mgnify:CR=1 FL=1